MKNCSERMKLIRKQISRYRSRCEKQMVVSMSALCFSFAGAIGILLGMKHQPGMFTLQTEYGSVLLHGAGEPYVVIGIAAFLSGAAFTIVCIKLNQRKQRSSRKESDV